MNVELHTVVPGYVMEPSRLYTYPTCLADVYHPAVEQIYLPEKHVAPINATVSVSSKSTGSRSFGSLKWKAYKRVSELVKEARTLDYSGQFVFDARFDTDGNIAHILDNICTPVLLARKLLSEHFDQSIDVHVILRERAANLAKQAYEVLRIPTICTDENVQGNVVEITPIFHLFGIQSQVFNFEFKHYNPTTAKRVFIPRKGNRRLSNNEEVTKFLEGRGFTTYYFENLTHSEKWSILRNAEEVVIVHGAGSANLVFNQLGLKSPDILGSGVRVVELFSPSYTLGGYRHLASLLNGRWCAVRGQITPDILQYLDFTQTPRDSLKSPIKDPFKVDLTSLELALEYLNSQSTLQNHYSVFV